MDCKAIEQQHPEYETARRIETEAVRNGNYNFPGVGLPDDLVALSRKARREREAKSMHATQDGYLLETETLLDGWIDMGIVTDPWTQNESRPIYPTLKQAVAKIVDVIETTEEQAQRGQRLPETACSPTQFRIVNLQTGEIYTFENQVAPIKVCFPDGTCVVADTLLSDF
jgi:hypothetical protein